MQGEKQQSVYVWGLFNGKEIPVPHKIKELEGRHINKVASGGHFYLALSAQGQLYGWGNTKYSRFGLYDEVPVPKQIPLKVVARAISAGNWHSMLVDDKGRLFAAGHNKQGACGTGHFNNVDSFAEVSTQTAFKSVSCGDCFSLMISVEDELHSCGHTDLHGHKQKEHLNQPKALSLEGETVALAAAGFSHSLAVTRKGQTYSWGLGGFHQLGHGSKHDLKQPKLVKALAEVKIVDVSCTRGEKNAHSMALSEDGVVYTWGAGYKGKLGHEQTWSHENQADEP